MKRRSRPLDHEDCGTFIWKSGTHKFRFRKNEKENFARHGFVKHEIVKHSKYWPTVIEKGHIGEGE
jgi:hypothetical protein